MPKSSTAQSLATIQNNILTKLKGTKSLKYSQLKPAKVANDLFNYHLQFLIKKDFVKKVGEGYSLSALGLKHIADPLITPEQNNIANLFNFF